VNKFNGSQASDDVQVESIETVISWLDISETDALRLSRILRDAMALYGKKEHEQDYETCRHWSQTFNLFARQCLATELLAPQEEAEFIAYLAQT